MKRVYENIVLEQLTHYKQMVFLAGPRQVGKTTIGKAIASDKTRFVYLNWDDVSDRNLILEGQQAVAEKYAITEISDQKPLVLFDEIHKYVHWKNFIKGFFDKYNELVKIIVTGSAKLNIYKHGGDSMMGRYFLYQIHPLTIAEIVRPIFTEQIISPPQLINPEDFKRLLDYGGFPEPYLNSNTRFSNRWRQRWEQQLFREDLRELSKVHEVVLLENLAKLIQLQVGQLTTYHELGKKIQVSEHTIKNWLNILSSVYHSFSIRPWTKNVSRTLIKQPKYYLWDWSVIREEGPRAENFVAVHLLKAVHFWTECGLGAYDLFYLRDKEKREVDFVVTRENKPWFLVEVKYSANHSINPALYHFQAECQAEHAFQVVFNREFVEQDCFQYHQPIIVPVQTLLSQLV